jgi:hypothetical protein
MDARSMLIPIVLVTGLVTKADAQSLQLDLTTPAVLHCERTAPVVCVPGGSVGGNLEGPALEKNLPVRLQILGIASKSYRLGEPVRATLLLTNAGDHAIPVPWSLNPDLVQRKDCTWAALPPGAKPLYASVAVQLVDDAGNSQAIDTHYLFGTTNDPAAYRDLKPNESLEIRLMGHLNVSFINQQRAQQKRKPIVLPAAFGVVGTFEYSDIPGYGEYPEVRSGNSVRVTIRRK